LGFLCNLTHWANLRFRKCATLSIEVADNILNHFTEFSKNSNRIISMYSGYKIGALADVHLIFITPFHPFVVFVEIFHLLTVSIACATCLSW